MKTIDDLALEALEAAGAVNNDPTFEEFAFGALEEATQNYPGYNQNDWQID